MKRCHPSHPSHPQNNAALGVLERSDVSLRELGHCTTQCVDYLMKADISAHPGMAFTLTLVAAVVFFLVLNMTRNVALQRTRRSPAWLRYAT
jgi:hypothetical protein